MIINKMSKRIRRWALALVLGASGLAIAGFAGDNFEIVKNLDIYYSMFRELNLFYVDEIDPGEVIKTSMDKMLASLDPYTVYIPESQIEDFRFMQTGQYGGVGAVFKVMAGIPVVTEVYEDSPANKADMKAGDQIMEVNRISCKGKSFEEINDLLNGQPNTRMNLRIKRPGLAEVLDMTLTREEIKVKSVPLAMMLDKETAYIKLNSFTQTASREIREALMQMRDQDKAKSLILDLRGNPGGLLHEAVEIINLFVEKDLEVVSTRGKVKDFDKVYKTQKAPIDAQMPVAILVNSGSASASEIVSGAFQDLDRGIVVGQRTFGKGLVQTVRDLSYNSKLKLTTAKYYIPSGRCIQALDYSHRKPDGSVGKIPDSLVTQFSTSLGRKVYDGGGVMPDVFVKPLVYSSISQALLRENLVFDFVSQYVQKHSSVAKPADFVLSESDFQEFMAFVKTRNFDYETQTSALLKKLRETAANEKYYALASNEFAALEKKLVLDRDKDMLVFKDEISELIATEIMSRYYFAQGRMKYSFRKDEELKKALSLLQTPSEYQKILSPGFQIPRNAPGE